MTTALYEGQVPVFTQGDRLRKARETTGKGVREFALLIGVSHQTITNAEHEHRNVRPITLNAWAMATGISVQWLKTGIAPESNGPEGETLPRLDSNQEPSGSQPPQVTRLREWPKSPATIQRAA